MLPTSHCTALRLASSHDGREGFPLDAFHKPDQESSNERLADLEGLLFYGVICNKTLISANIILTVVVPNNELLPDTISVRSGV